MNKLPPELIDLILRDLCFRDLRRLNCPVYSLEHKAAEKIQRWWFHIKPNVKPKPQDPTPYKICDKTWLPANPNKSDMIVLNCKVKRVSSRGEYHVDHAMYGISSIIVPDFEGKEKCCLAVKIGAVEIVKWPLVGNIFTFSIPIYTLASVFHSVYIHLSGPSDSSGPRGPRGPRGPLGPFPETLIARSFILSFPYGDFIRRNPLPVVYGSRCLGKYASGMFVTPAYGLPSDNDEIIQAHSSRSEKKEKNLYLNFGY